jgi:peptide-methionine (S)-S-oxide reductase
MQNRYSVFILFFYLISCNTSGVESKELIKTNTIQQPMDKITFGAGCFWCVEAVYSDLNGVESVVSGYAGGTVKNPSYKEVCTGNTGHAEVCQITYNPSVISYKELLEVFLASTRSNHPKPTRRRCWNSVSFSNFLSYR